MQKKLGLLPAFALILAGCSGQPSFYYEIDVENQTSFEYLNFRLIQLTEVYSLGKEGVEVSELLVVSSKKTGRLYGPGGDDADSAIFILKAIPCNKTGYRKESPREHVFLKILRHQDFTIWPTPVTPHKKVVVKDEDMLSVSNFDKLVESIAQLQIE